MSFCLSCFVNGSYASPLISSVSSILWVYYFAWSSSINKFENDFRALLVASHNNVLPLDNAAALDELCSEIESGVTEEEPQVYYL